MATTKPVPSTHLDPSVTERAVLALLCEEPAHGFALATSLRPDSDIGRVFTVRRPLVYRALNNLVSLDLARADHEEPGAAGPRRVVHVATTTGHDLTAAWLSEPVAHVRDVRTQLLLKLLLLERSNEPTVTLVRAQQRVLDETLQQLIERGRSGDVVDQWRAGSARATMEFLNDLSEGSLNEPA